MFKKIVLLAFACLCLGSIFSWATGPCDCDCLMAAVLDPDTDPHDRVNLLNALDDYGCG